MIELTNEQIHEIAETIDATPDTCYINSETGEVIFMMSNEMLREYGILWDKDEEEDEAEEEKVSNESLSWQDELYMNVKADMAKIYSWEWKHTIRIKKPESHESFKIMERFVEEIIPEGRLKQDFWKALSRSHPFRNFNAIVHNCAYRENWFTFKQQALEEYVRTKISEYKI